MSNFKVREYPIIGHLTDEKKEDLRSAGKWGAVAFVVSGLITVIFAELLGADLGTALLEGLTSGSVISLGTFIVSCLRRSRKREKEQLRFEERPTSEIVENEEKDDAKEKAIDELKAAASRLATAKKLDWYDLQDAFRNVIKHLNREELVEYANKYLDSMKDSERGEIVMQQLINAMDLGEIQDHFSNQIGIIKIKKM